MIRLCVLVVTGAGLIWSTTACRHYDRRPLELERHLAAWSTRSIDTEPVQAYMRRLASDDDLTSIEFDESDGLTIQEAEAIALHFNPGLRLARARAEVPLAGARESGWWPDPDLSVSVLRFADRGRQSGVRLDGPSITGINAGGLESSPIGIRQVNSDYVDDPWIVGASLSVTIPLSGRVAVEKDLAWSTYTTEWRRIVIAEWGILRSLRAKWLAWSATCERVALAEQYIQQLDQVSESARQLATAGELKPARARLFEIEVARQRADLGMLEAEATEQRLVLLSVMGLAPHALVELVPSVFVQDVPESEDERRDGLIHHHPRVQAARAAYETAEQQLRLEIRKQYPDLSVGPKYSFEEGLSRIGMSLGAPIPLWNRNRQAVAEAEANREAARVEAETTVELAMSELAIAEASRQAARKRVAMLAESVAPLVDRQIEETRKLLEVGEVDVLVLRDALTSSLETKLQILDATLGEAVAADDLMAIVHPRWVTQAETSNGEDSE